MGKFHEDMIEARRRGEMLTPPPTQEAPAPPPTPFRMPTFVEPTDVPLVCTVCGCLVDRQFTPQHVAEHAKLSS